VLGLTLDPLYKAIGWLVAFLYSLPPHNLGLSIILMTIVVMLVQFPFIAKQTRGMIQMQRVQPEIKKIQQKYKDDRQKQNEELLKFYQENKINPVASCIPMLLVMPIGIAVFRSFQQGVVINKKTGVVTHAWRGLQGHIPHTGAFGRLYADICGRASAVPDCAKALNQHTPRAMHFLGINLNWSASEVSRKLPGHVVQWAPYYGLIALVVATGWYQAHQTQARQLRQGGAPPNQQMQMMTRVLPVVFGLITYGLNAATTLYFVVSNAWRIGQQHFVLNKMYEEEGFGGSTPPAKPKPEPPSGGGAAKPTTKGGSSRPPGRTAPSNAARNKKKRKR
jgi:YidC/Oxa1 family membrane protein insertase